MNDGLIPNRYAKALYKYALEKNVTKEVYTQMKALASAFVALPEMQQMVENPYLSIADKKKVIMEAAGAESGGAVSRFIDLLEKNNRITFLRETALAYQKLYRKDNKIEVVEIVTAAKVSDEELDKLRSVVQNHEKGMTLEFSHKVDPDLIGGFTLAMENKMLDASIKNELKNLRLTLLR